MDRREKNQKNGISIGEKDRVHFSNISQNELLFRPAYKQTLNLTPNPSPAYKQTLNIAPNPSPAVAGSTFCPYDDGCVLCRSG